MTPCAVYMPQVALCVRMLRCAGTEYCMRALSNLQLQQRIQPMAV